MVGHHSKRANDPSVTLAVHCGKGFDAGFSPYQSIRLSRYNAFLPSLGKGASFLSLEMRARSSTVGGGRRKQQR